MASLLIPVKIPVERGEKNYPDPIKAKIQEISGHFAVEREDISIELPYSLHTEASHSQHTRKRKKTTFNSFIVNNFENIAQKDESGKFVKVPQLWHSPEWAKEFFEFIHWLVGDNKPPEILEIHPPFTDYCASFGDFLDIFNVFQKLFKDKYPETKIVIENRCGTHYKGKFLLSTYSDVLEFAGILKANQDIGLRIVLDYPQIFTAIIGGDDKINMDNLEGAVKEIKESFNPRLEEYRGMVVGLHMWGKKKDKMEKWKPHAGDFNTFFGCGRELEELNDKEKEMKDNFLMSVFDTFNDDIPRYFVPEVYLGSQNDLHSIVKDMEDAGFTFI